jgi:hypothetical protein
MTPPDREERGRDQGWRPRVRGIVAERLGLKATALAIALLLWFIVRVVHLAGTAP